MSLKLFVFGESSGVNSVDWGGSHNFSLVIAKDAEEARAIASRNDSCDDGIFAEVDMSKSKELVTVQGFVHGRCYDQ